LNNKIRQFQAAVELLRPNLTALYLIKHVLLYIELNEINYIVKHARPILLN